MRVTYDAFGSPQRSRANRSYGHSRYIVNLRYTVVRLPFHSSMSNSVCMTFRDQRYRTANRSVPSKLDRLVRVDEKSD